MNQERVSWINGIAIAVLFMGGGILFTLVNTGLWSRYAILLVVAFLAGGFRELHSIIKTANAWSFNKTPYTFHHAPRGEWRVVGVAFDKHFIYDQVVYVTIVAPLTHGLFSTLRLHSEWIRIEDYQRMVNGEQPLSVSIRDRVTFTWPLEEGALSKAA